MTSVDSSISERPRVVRATSFGTRARGLLFRPRESWVGVWLVLERTHAVHTLMMRYPIDIAFCDVNGVVLHVQDNVDPGRPFIGFEGAAFVVERPSGGSGEVWPSIGERLVLK